MSEIFAEYGLFVAKTITFVVAFGVIIALIAAAAQRRRRDPEGEIKVSSLNEHFEDMQHALEDAVFDEYKLKQIVKEQKKRDKAEAKAQKAAAKKSIEDEPERKRIYVLDFDGDIHASDAEAMRQEVSAILSLAREEDEVVVRLESPGGLVHSYGFAASQLERIRRRNIPLTVCVDKVAASGGYMMACIANKLLAAPFALIGSIGVVAQIPNFHRLLQRNDVDYEVLTAGEYKRTLTMFGENTEAGRQKFQEELEDTHNLFKEFVGEYRPNLNIEEIATGEVWFGRRALDKGLIDGLETSDDYLFNAVDDADILKVSYEHKLSLQEKLQGFGANLVDASVGKLWSRLSQSRFWAR